MRSKYIIGGLIIIGFTVWAGISFKATLTPYVTIQDAKQSHEIVQVKGERLGEGQFDVQKNLFFFKIKDEKKLGDHTVLIEEARLSSKLIKRRKEICSVAFWYCPEMNRIYFLALDTQVHRPLPFKINLKIDEHEALFNEVLDSFRCH